MNICITVANAYEVSDSTKTLQEVVVEGQLSSTDGRKTTYLTTKNDRKHSVNGYDLLHLMAIPQLRIDGNLVKSLSGESVECYINGVPASDMDMLGIRTANVVKVEYMENPIDAKFMGKKFVVNIIVEEPTYGGYTLINNNLNALNQIANASLAYSKMKIDNTSVSVFFNPSFGYLHHGGDDMREFFNLTTPSGDMNSFSKKTTVDRVNKKSYSLPFGITIMHDSSNSIISNTIGYSFGNTPYSDQDGSVNLFQKTGNLPSLDYTYSRSNSAIDRILAWNGVFYFFFNNGWSLNIMPRLAYTNSSSYSSYLPSTSTFSKIVNNAKTDKLNTYIDLMVSKQIGLHNIGLQVLAAYENNRLEYEGTTPGKDHFRDLTTNANLLYNLYKNRFSLRASLGVFGNYNKTNTVSYSKFFPSGSVYLSYNFNSKNSITGNVGCYVSSPSGTQISDLTQKKDEFSYTTGNKNLRSTTSYYLNFNYTWLPSNRFQIAVHGSTSYDHNPLMSMYLPDPENNAIIQTQMNGKSIWAFDMYGSITFRNPTNNLILSLTPYYHYFRTKGIYNMHAQWFAIDLNATYILKDFRFSGFVRTPYKNAADYEPLKSKHRTSYNISVGWSKKNWQLNLQISNFFRNHWRRNHLTLNTEYYSYSRDLLGITGHRSISFTIQYIFSYGKKIDIEAIQNKQIFSESDEK